MTHTLAATIRNEQGSRACARLRESGKLPGVVYGAGRETVPVVLTVKAFEKMWAEAGESAVIALTGLGSEVSVLIQDVTVEPIFGTPTHVDFLAVRTDQLVEVSIPLSFTGSAPAEKLGGTLIKVMRDIVVAALPKNLPQEIEVDVSTLATYDDQIHVSDITLPSGVTAITSVEEVVALVQPMQEAEEETVSVDLASVQVAKKGKEEAE